MIEPRSQLLKLGLSDSEVTVYLAMVSGARTAFDLQKTTSLKRPTIYYALGCLEKRGLLSKTGLEGDKRFHLEPISRLKDLVEEKVQEAEGLKAEVNELLPFLESTSSPAGPKPTVSFFEGTSAVKHVIMDMLYSKKKHIDSIVPKQNFFWEVGEEFVQSFVTQRIKRTIKTRNLWDTNIDTDVLKEYYEDLSEVRLLPEIMHGKFHSTIFLYDDKTLYISSKQNSYCVVITSQEHYDTMRALFDGLWSVSNPHPQ